MERLNSPVQTGIVETLVQHARDTTEEQVTIPKSMVLELAHEVRNPLTLIKSTVQMIQLKYKDIDSKYFNGILREVDRVNRILEEFVTLAKSQKSQEIISMNQLLQEIHQLLEGEARLRQIDLDVEIPQEEILILGYLDQFKQVLLNLSRNSMEAMKSDGQLSYRLEIMPGKILQITIEDTGTGIDQKIIDQIFEPFFTTKEKGTGLGLAICKRIIEEHQGEIFVRNNAEQGCTFYLQLPIYEGLQRACK